MTFLTVTTMSDNIQLWIAQLDRIATALERLSAPKQRLGFFNYSQKIYANITKGNGDGWYCLEGERAITQPPIFRGYLVDMGFPTVARRGQEVRKLHLVMRAGDRTVTFESGYDCFFAKSVLAALATTDPAVLAQPMQLSTFVKQLRTGDQTLAVSLRDAAGKPLACDWKNDDDWRAIAIVAMAKVEAAVKYRQ